MKIIRCAENKHFYDADLYEICPHCRKEKSGDAPNNKVPTRPEHAQSPESQPRRVTAPPAPEPGYPQDADVSECSPVRDRELPDAVFCTKCGKPLPAANQYCTDCGAKVIIPVFTPEQGAPQREHPHIKAPGESQTNAIWGRRQNKTSYILGGATDIMQTLAPDRGASQAPEEKPLQPPAAPAWPPSLSATPPPQMAKPQPFREAKNAGNELQAAKPKPFHEAKNAGNELQAAKPEPFHEAKNAGNELQQAVAAVASHRASEDAKTVAFYDFGSDESPVVGWLVCVRGEYKGQGFDIISGQNYIGRAQNMNIALAREATVSRNRHARIIFDPAKQAFHIQQGESSGLTYLNGELVMEASELCAYDRVKLGNAEFVFVPFCCDRFSWEDYA